jgi:hypothetical protein
MPQAETFSEVRPIQPGTAPSETFTDLQAVPLPSTSTTTRPGLWQAATTPVGGPANEAEALRNRISNLAGEYLPPEVAGPTSYVANLLTAVPASMVEFGHRMMTPLNVATMGANALTEAASLPGWLKEAAGAAQTAGSAAFGGQGVAQVLTPQEGETVPEAVSRIAGGVGQTVLGGAGAAAGISELRGKPSLEQVPRKLAKGLGFTSPDVERTLETYQKTMPYLADIERAGQGGNAEAILKATRKASDELGKPFNQAVEQYASTPLGGDPEIDQNIRDMAKAEAGPAPSKLQKTDPKVAQLQAIGNGQGPLTIDDADFMRQYAGLQSSTYHKQINAGSPTAQKSFTDWTSAENYLRNVEYNRIKQLTGVDADSIQADRSQLIQLQAAAARKWASDVKRDPIGIAQSIGIPFGISRIIRGGMSFDLPEVLSGASEVGAFTGWKWLMNRTLRSAMGTLGRSELTALPYPQATLAPTLPQQAPALPSAQQVTLTPSGLGP